VNSCRVRTHEYPQGTSAEAAKGSFLAEDQAGAGTRDATVAKIFFAQLTIPHEKINYGVSATPATLIKTHQLVHYPEI